ncbi:hypothetical protein AAFC00_005778 [Neodothiora populina]
MHINTEDLSRDVSPMASPTLSIAHSRHSAVSSVDESLDASPVFSTSGHHPDTVNTAYSDTATEPSLQHSCNYDADDWFGKFRDDVDVSDDCPDRGTLAAAGEVMLYDAYGNMRPFSTFFTGLDAIGDRQLIIFIRHFYCGACQAYLQKIVEGISMQAYYTMPIPTSFVVVGCGSPELIPHFKSQTNCPFPIFAEPTRKIYRVLGMSMSVNIGMRRPGYMKGINEGAWVFGQLRQMGQTKGAKKFRGGNWLQIGGEFLFQDGQVVWCHRMRNYRDHTEVARLKRILEIDD